MADGDAAAKVRIYYTIYRLNLSFANIVAHCRALRESGILEPKNTRLYQFYAQELQAEINEEVVAIMDHVELRDMHRFGKARIAREKDLRDPDDVFIHAEDRRRELARQGKKPPALKRSKTPRSQSDTVRKSKRSSSQYAARRMRKS
jgi:hypothetical protein